MMNLFGKTDIQTEISLPPDLHQNLLWHIRRFRYKNTQNAILKFINDGLYKTSIDLHPDLLEKLEKERRTQKKRTLDNVIAEIIYKYFDESWIRWEFFTQNDVRDFAAKNTAHLFAENGEESSYEKIFSKELPVLVAAIINSHDELQNKVRSLELEIRRLNRQKQMESQLQTPVDDLQELSTKSIPIKRLPKQYCETELPTPTS